MKAITYQELQQYILSNAENNIFHHSYGLEEKLTNFWVNPIPAQPLELPEITADIPYGILSYEEKKQAEYSAVSLAVLITRYGIQAGADPTEAYCPGDMYLQQISDITNEKDYWRIQPLIIQSFHELIRLSQKKKKQIYHIQKTKNYIKQHLNSSFTIHDLAEHAGISPNYLCALFKKTEGQTIMEYTQHCRMEAAKNMLRFSDFSITEISDYLCYSSPSHFASTFHKVTGVTPSEYRRENHSW